MNVGLQKTSLINYPKRVSAAVFLPGCNLRCPYCYNAELVYASITDGPRRNKGQFSRNEYVPVEEVYTHIEKRKSVLSGLVISGGEALLSPVLPELIIRAKKAGLAVKLDTNGLLPDALSAVADDPALRPDMIALDIKTSLSRYSELGFCRYGHSNDAGETPSILLEKTLNLLCRISTVYNQIAVEYRTVLVPPLVADTEILEIAEKLPVSASWFLAPFIPGDCLNPAWNSIKPYTQSRTADLLQLARTKIPHAQLR